MAYNTKPPKKKTDISTVKQERSQFVQMLISVQAGRDINEDVFACENNEFPPSLTRRGETYFGNKSELLSCLESSIHSSEITDS